MKPLNIVNPCRPAETPAPEPVNINNTEEDDSLLHHSTQDPEKVEPQQQPPVTLPDKPQTTTR